MKYKVKKFRRGEVISLEEKTFRVLSTNTTKQYTLHDLSMSKKHGRFIYSQRYVEEKGERV